jgi:hypothetical protein
MVQGIKTICNYSLISAAFSGSMCIISGNRVMSEFEVSMANLKEREQYVDLAVDWSVIINWILNK